MEQAENTQPPRRPRSRPRHPTEAELERAMRLAEESGELRHLYGKPLDLSDSTPEWFAKKMLKDQGFSHPLIEQARDLERAGQAVEAVAERLARRRAWLMREGRAVSWEEAQHFNRSREEALESYVDRLRQHNSAILTHNLGAPDWLHQRTVNVDQAVQSLAERVPPLTPTPRPVQSPFLGWLSSVRRRLRRR